MTSPGLSVARADFEALTRAPGWTVLDRPGEETDMRASRPVEGGEVFLRVSFAPSLPANAARIDDPVSKGGRVGGDVPSKPTPPVKYQKEGF